MELASDSYEDVTLVYTRLIQAESQEAAAALDQIQVAFGSRAALRAALIITIFNEETQHYHSIPDIRMYTYLLKDYRDAIPLLEDAITACLISTGISEKDKSGWEKWLRLLKTHSAVPRNPYEDLVQRVRQHNPITAVKLEQIYETRGITLGDYAATALIWLQARIDLYGNPGLTDLTDQDIREFTYFKFAGKQIEAEADFMVMLDCYRIEHGAERIRFPQVISLLSR